ncbi:MAG: hypothetical protein ACFFG0_55860, partial [Candidatus Thorarchaeota archaeon]
MKNERKVKLGGLFELPIEGSSQIQLERKNWSNRLPVLWKRSIKKIIKNDRVYALELFFKTYKLGTDLPQMQYGLELLQPESVLYIVQKLSVLKPEESSRFLTLLTSSSLLSVIPSLSEDDQTEILKQIYRVGSTALFPKDLTQALLGQITPTLAIILFQKEFKDSEKIISIFQLWGTVILHPLILYHLTTPTDAIISVFLSCSVSDRVQTFNKIESLLTPKNFSNFLELITPSTEELNFLLTNVYPTLKKSALNTLHIWLLKKEVDEKILVSILQTSGNQSLQNFIQNNLLARLEIPDSHPSRILTTIIKTDQANLAHDLLKAMKTTDQQKLGILLEVISILEPQISKYADFFNEELSIYALQNFNQVLSSYVQSANDSFRLVLLPILQESAKKQNKLFIKEIAANNQIVVPSHAIKVFNLCN